MPLVPIVSEVVLPHHRDPVDLLQPVGMAYRVRRNAIN